LAQLEHSVAEERNQIISILQFHLPLLHTMLSMCNVMILSLRLMAPGIHGKDLLHSTPRQNPSLDYIQRLLSLFGFSVSSTTKSFSDLFPSFQLPSRSKKKITLVNDFFFQHVFQSLDPDLVLRQIRVSHHLQHLRQG
jgi:hypothetical protein